MSKPIATEPSTASRSKSTLLVLLGLAQLVLVASLGCRSTTDNQIDLLERELRVQEDYIYELEDYVVEYSEKLRDCRSCPPQQTASYSEEVYEPEPAAKRSKKSTRRRREQEEPSQETEDEQTPETSPEDLEVPGEIEFELGDPISDTEDYQQQIQPAAFEQEYESTEDELMIPSPLDYLDSSEHEDDSPEQEGFEEENYEENYNDEPSAAVFVDEQVEETTAAVIRVAERLEVTRLFQGEGDQLSPQNLLAVVEALDANDEPVDLDGEVSLMIMTTDEAAPERLKRWNFTAAETTDAWQSSDLGDGLHLELPLEELQLPAAPLEIWVRLVTSDGRKLLTKLPFEPSQLSDIADHAPPPHPHGLVLAETETEIESEATPVNSLRMNTNRDSLNQNEKLADSKESADKPRWRASMQRTDRTSEGFATSAGKSSGWTKQSPGRQQYVYPRIVLPARTQQAIKPASKPVWTSGRTILPTSSTTTTTR